MILCVFIMILSGRKPTWNHCSHFHILICVFWFSSVRVCRCLIGFLALSMFCVVNVFLSVGWFAFEVCMCVVYISFVCVSSYERMTLRQNQFRITLNAYFVFLVRIDNRLRLLSQYDLFSAFFDLDFKSLSSLKTWMVIFVGLASCYCIVLTCKRGWLALRHRERERWYIENNIDFNIKSK